MSIRQAKKESRNRRRARIRAKVFGTKDRPRLAVFKSNKYLYVQIIDDEAQNTLCAGNTKDMKGDDVVSELGKDITEKARKAGIAEVVFDRGGFIYIGKIKKFADACREAGLKL